MKFIGFLCIMLSLKATVFATPDLDTNSDRSLIGNTWKSYEKLSIEHVDKSINDFLALINLERVNVTIPVLEIDSSLMNLAQQEADKMAKGNLITKPWLNSTFPYMMAEIVNVTGYFKSNLNYIGSKQCFDNFDGKYADEYYIMNFCFNNKFEQMTRIGYGKAYDLWKNVIIVYLYGSNVLPVEKSVLEKPTIEILDEKIATQLDALNSWRTMYNATVLFVDYGLMDLAQQEAERMAKEGELSIPTLNTTFKYLMGETFNFTSYFGVSQSFFGVKKCFDNFLTVYKTDLYFSEDDCLDSAKVDGMNRFGFGRAYDAYKNIINVVFYANDFLKL